MSQLGSVLVVKFNALFKDGQLFDQLVQAGFEKDAVVPGAIRAQATGKMNKNLYLRVISSGAEVDVLDEVLDIPPSTRAVEPDWDENAKDVVEANKDAEPLTLDGLNMTAHALKMAQDNGIDAVALFDQFGEEQITKGDVAQYIQSLRE